MNYIKFGFYVVSILVTTFGSAQAQSRNQTFDYELISCMPTPVLIDGRPAFFNLSIYVGDSKDGIRTKSAAIHSFAMRATDSPSSLAQSVSVGEIITKGLISADFKVKSPRFRISLNLKEAHSTLKLEVLEDQKWVQYFNGAAVCNFVQYESVGVHNQK